MSSDIIRKQITLSSKKQQKEFDKFQHDIGYSSFSHMCRDSIQKNRKNFYSKNSQEMKKLEEMVLILQDIIIKNFETLNQRVEVIGMRINKEGLNSEVGRAMDDILKLVHSRDIDHSEILINCKKYDEKTLNSALSLLLDAEKIGMKNKKTEKKYERRKK